MRLLLIVCFIFVGGVVYSQKITNNKSKITASGDDVVASPGEITTLSPKLNDYVYDKTNNKGYLIKADSIPGYPIDTNYVIPTSNGLYAVLVPANTTYVSCMDSALMLPHLVVGSFVYVKSRVCGYNYGGGLFVVTNSGATTDGGTVFAFDKDLVPVSYTGNAANYTVGSTQEEYWEHTLNDGNINWGSYRLSRPDFSVSIPALTDTLDVQKIQYMANMIDYQTANTYWLYRFCLVVQDPENQFVTTTYDTIKTNIRLERVDNIDHMDIDWFGAIRNDSTINNAGVIEEAMRVADRNGVKKVYVPGLYYYQSTITMPNNLILYGDGPGKSILRTSTKEMFDYYYSTDAGSSYPNRTFRRVVYNASGYSSAKLTDKNTLDQRTFYNNQEITTFRLDGIELDGCIENYLISSSDPNYPDLYNNLLNGGFHNAVALGNSDSLGIYYLNHVAIHSYGGNLMVKGIEGYNAFMIANDLTLGNSSHNHHLYTVNGVINNLYVYGYSNGAWLDAKGLIIDGFRAHIYANPIGYPNSSLRLFTLRGEEVPFGFQNAGVVGPQDLVKEQCVINNAEVKVDGISITFLMGFWQGVKITDVNVDLKNQASLVFLQNLANGQSSYKYGLDIKGVTVRAGTNSEVSIITSTDTNIPVYQSLNIDGFQILGQTNYFPVSKSVNQNALFNINLGSYNTVHGGKLFTLSDVTKDSLTGEHYTVSFVNGAAQPTPTPKVFWFDVSGSDSPPALGGGVTYHEIDISSTVNQAGILDSMVAVMNRQDTLISQEYTVYSSTGHVGYDPQGYGYINVDTDSTRVIFQNHTLSYNKAPINWVINNLTSNIPFSDAQGLLDIQYAPDTLNYGYNITFTNCDFPITGATNIMFRYIGNAKYQGYSTFAGLDLRFDGCNFRYRDLSNLDVQKFVEPWFNVAKFERCKWVNVTCGGTVVERTTNPKTSEQTSDYEFTATASQATQDFSNCLIWEPRGFNIIASNEAFNVWVDSITVINARTTIPGHPTVSSINTAFRLHMASGIPNGTVIKFRYETYMSKFDLPTAYESYDLVYDMK